MTAVVVLAKIAEMFLGALVGQVTEQLRSKLEKDPAKEAFKQALGAAIERYSRTGSRLALAQPLLQEDGPLTEPSVAQEFAKIVQFDREPNVELIGERWKASLFNPPHWRNFTAEAELLLRYLRSELRGTDAFRPVFDAKSLDHIAIAETTSSETLSRVETRLASLSDLIAERFGDLALAFAGAPPDINDNIRDYSDLVEEKTVDFVGRRFVFDAVAQFIEQNPRGYYFIRGDPGIGKTALAAQLIKTQGYVHHFNIRANGVNKADIFLRNICSQLIAAYELGYTGLPSEATQNAGFLSRLFNEISDKLEAGDKAVIIVDALDEVDDAGLPPGVNTLYLPITLPQGVYIIATMRRVPIHLRIECEQDTLDIEQDSEGNIADICEYITAKAGSEAIQAYIAAQGLDTTEFINRLVEKSQGNFMYLYYVIPEIERGAYRDLVLDAIPTGLQNYYEDHWQRMRGENEEAWFEYKLPIIVALTVVKAPVSVDLIVDLSGVEHRARVRDVLQNWAQFLREEQVEYEGSLQKRYRVYHASFHDFIAKKEQVKDEGEQISRRKAHEKIADSLWKELF